MPAFLAKCLDIARDNKQLQDRTKTRPAEDIQSLVDNQT